MCAHSRWFSPDSAAGGGAGSLTERWTCLAAAPPPWSSVTHTHARTQTQRMRALHFPSQRHRRDVGGVRPAAASVPDLKGSSCTEVASVGEGDKSKTDKVVLLAFTGRH